MPATELPRFLRDTAIHSFGDGRYRADIDRGWWIERGPNGGYLAAIILRALLAEVGDRERTPRTLTVHYLEPPHEGPVSLSVVVERAGRGLSTVSARVVQDGTLVALALAAVARSRGGEGFDERMPPSELGAGPGAVAVAEETPIPLAERFENRPVIGGRPFTGGDEAVSGGWIRLREPVPVDAVVVTMLTDAWTPAVFSRVSSMVAVPTVELTVHFRHPVPDAVAGDYCFVRFRSRTAVEGFVEEDGEIWSANGALLAQSRQLSAFIPVG